MALSSFSEEWWFDPKRDEGAGSQVIAEGAVLYHHLVSEKHILAGFLHDHRCRQRYGLFLLVVVYSCVCVLFVFSVYVSFRPQQTGSESMEKV